MEIWIRFDEGYIEIAAGREEDDEEGFDHLYSDHHSVLPSV